MTWTRIPFDEPTYQNSVEEILTQAMAAGENCYWNDSGGQSRFPGIKDFVSLPGTRVWLHDYRNDMIAVTDRGRIFRISRAGDVQDVTLVPLSGAGRPIFAETEDALLISAGGPIISLSNDKSEVLSLDAPNATHVAFLQGFVIANEPFSGRLFYSEPGIYDEWPPDNFFTAEAKPDDVNAVVVTPYNELLACGIDSIEQFEPFPSGERPFERRFTTGEGLKYPYTVVANKYGTFGVNRLDEFVRFQLQSSDTQSDDVQLALEELDDKSEAWCQEINIKGQDFMILQFPNAENSYGTQGVTYLFDYKKMIWTQLFSWDYQRGTPARWPGWSVLPIWGRQFVGVEGGVAELDRRVFADRDKPLRMLVRTGHIDEWGSSRINRIRIRIKRGLAPSGEHRSVMGFRVNRDNRGFGRWIEKDLGRFGERELIVELPGVGAARTWQFEYFVTDPTAVEFVGAQADIDRLPR